MESEFPSDQSWEDAIMEMFKREEALAEKKDIEKQSKAGPSGDKDKEENKKRPQEGESNKNKKIKKEK